MLSHDWDHPVLLLCPRESSSVFPLLLPIPTLTRANRVRSVGDQHRGGPKSVMMPNATASATGNPFEEPQRRMSEYTAQEIATLQARLDKKLGPEYISSRPGAAGQRVHYLSADKCINLANEVFGFNGWSSSIQNIQIDFVCIMEPFAS